MTLALALTLVTQATIGEVSKTEFLGLVRQSGFTAVNDPWKHGATLGDGKTSAKVEIYFTSRSGGRESMSHVRGQVEFELPKTLSQEDLAQWQKEAKIEKAGLRTYLGGRVALQMEIARPETRRDELKDQLSEFFANIHKLNEFAAKRGGGLADPETYIGKAPLNLDDRLTVIDARDFEYLRVNLKWGELASPGGGKGWITGAHPLGVRVYFGGMPGHAAFGMTWMGNVKDEAHRERVRESTKDWSQVHIQDDFLHLSQFVKTDKGMSVREIVTHVEGFARQIKELGLVR